MSLLFRKKAKAAPAPVAPPPPPPVPTIDSAAMADENARKFARRKGRLAHMKSKAATTANPSVNVKTVLG